MSAATARAEVTRIEMPYHRRRWARPFHEAMARVRWAVLVLHRRAGKTTAALNHHLRAATDDRWESARLKALNPALTDPQLRELLRGRVYGHILPYRNQAKLTAWDMLKWYAAPIPGHQVNESELLITTPPTPMNPVGSKVFLFGADNQEGLRGPAFSGLSLDEYGQHPPNIFGEVLSKALADHLGYAIFLGTIKGENQLYRLHQAAKDDPEWFALWQDINTSLSTEDDAAIAMLRQAMKDDEGLIQKGVMTRAEYDQERFLSTVAAIRGAYFGQEMAAASKEGRITRVPFDPALPVDTDWDIGVDDETVIWFSQSLRSREVRFIDFYANSGEGLGHYLRILQEKQRDLHYVYGEHWGPHDIEVREWGNDAKSRKESAKALGLHFEVTPALGLADGIEAVRRFLPRCWFDKDRCAAGLSALTQYRKGFNDKYQQFTGTPIHDWTSHASDAFRGCAVRQVPPKGERTRQRRPLTGHAGRPPQGLGWMRH